jgi:hypothetical protein
MSRFASGFEKKVSYYVVIIGIFSVRGNRSGMSIGERVGRGGGGRDKDADAKFDNHESTPSTHRVVSAHPLLGAAGRDDDGTLARFAVLLRVLHELGNDLFCFVYFSFRSREMVCV